MPQDYFDFDEPKDKPISMPAPADNEIPVEFTWNWWDPWPSGLTVRDCLIRQISRDRRALIEDDVTPAEQMFYAERIVSYILALQEMGDGVSPQQASAVAPGKD